MDELSTDIEWDFRPFELILTLLGPSHRLIIWLQPPLCDHKTIGLQFDRGLGLGKCQLIDVG